MTKFKPGDKVRVNATSPVKHAWPHVLTVVGPAREASFYEVEAGVEDSGYTAPFLDSELDLVEADAPAFNVGDKVIVTSDAYVGLADLVGEVGTVTRVAPLSYPYPYYAVEIEGKPSPLHDWQFAASELAPVTFVLADGLYRSAEDDLVLVENGRLRPLDFRDGLAHVEAWDPDAAIPTEFGLYIDIDGDFWRLGHTGWACWDDHFGGISEVYSDYLPLRPLVAVA